MHLLTKSGIAMATLIAACLGYASLAQAAPAMRMMEVPSAVETLPVKTHGTSKSSTRHHYHHHHYHPTTTTTTTTTTTRCRAGGIVLKIGCLRPAKTPSRLEPSNFHYHRVSVSRLAMLSRHALGFLGLRNCSS